MPSIYTEPTSAECQFTASEFSQLTNDTIPNLPSEAEKTLNISYVEAPCSGGKTFALIKFVAERSQRATVEEPERIMIVVPSKRLLKQISDDLGKEGTNGVTPIHSSKRHGNGNGNRTVQSRVMEYLTHQNRQSGASVLLITHHTFLKLPFIPNINDWLIFIDEIPQIDFFEDTNLPISRGLFNKYLEGGDYFGSLVEIVEREGANLKALLDTHDSGIEAFRDLFSRVRSENFGIYVTIEQYDGTLNNPDVDATSEFKVHFLTLANPGLFQNCCFLAADFRKSLIYNRLAQCGVTPRLNEEFASNLRYTTYPEAVGQRTRILYCLEDRSYSLNIQDRPTADGGTVKEEVDKVIINVVGGSSFLLVKNKDDNGSLATHKNAVVIESIPSGLNCYAEHITLVFSAALNRPPKHISMLKAVGLDQDAINHSILIDRVHQSSMRTNLRVPDSNKSVTIVVVDSYTAKALGSILGCTDIQRIGNIDLPEKHTTHLLPNYTDAQRKKRSGFLKLMNEVTQFNVQDSCVQDNAFLREHLSFKNRACTHESANSLRYEPTIQYTLFRKPDAFNKSQFRTQSCGVAAFVRFLEQAATTIQEDKDDIWLFSMAVYQEITETSGFRSYDNFFYSTALVFDFDSGDATPERVEEVIWPTDNTKKRERCSYIICNSFSNSPEKSNRFRVIIPFRIPVRSVRLHQFIYQVFIDRFTEAGIPPTTSGLDYASKSPVQPYRLPCTNRLHPEHAFFRHKGMTARGFVSHSLDPARWERVMPIELDRSEAEHDERTTHAHWHADKSPTVLAEVERRKIEIQALKECRRQPIYDLALYLKQKHWSFEDIKTVLAEVAGRDRTKKRHAKGAMDFLKRWKE